MDDGFLKFSLDCHIVSRTRCRQTTLCGVVGISVWKRTAPTFASSRAMFSIGPYSIAGRVILAPMAGITDRPFRQLCRAQGAALAVSEMVTSDTRLWNSRKSQTRLNHAGECGVRSVQIAGSDPDMMADAARANVERGAQVIDINMGCPAKKVCNKAAGSALLQNEPLVGQILAAVVDAVDVPVTLKIRTGWDEQHRNAVRIGKMAQDAGIQALAIHGRTRACRFMGEAEYNTIAEVVDALDIPVIANGDITTPEKAVHVLKKTRAAAVMIGRGAQGQPWIFREINHFLEHQTAMPAMSLEEKARTILAHLRALYDFYGDFMGVRIARKHLGWYLKPLGVSDTFRRHLNGLNNTTEQYQQVARFFDERNTTIGDLTA